VVIPKEVRNAVGITEGDKLIIDVVEDTIVIKQKPKSYSKKLKGLHKDVWRGIDPLKYVKKERESW
jgi:AbrB family looped-hinge helix DNA binding protein